MSTYSIGDRVEILTGDNKGFVGVIATNSRGRDCPYGINLDDKANCSYGNGEAWAKKDYCDIASQSDIRLIDTLHDHGLKFKVGDEVRAIDESCGWGSISKNDIGKIIKIDHHRIIVDFPNQEDWECKEKDIELVSKDYAKLKIGDRVRFLDKKSGDRIPDFYSDNDDIPKNKIQHGSTLLGDNYDTDFAFIVDRYNEYYIVEYKDDNNVYVQLGFKAEDLALVNRKDEGKDEYQKDNHSAESKLKTMLQTIPKTLKRVLSSDLRKQYKAGLINGDLELTEKGRIEMLDILSQQEVVKKGLTKYAEQLIKKDKKENN